MSRMGRFPLKKIIIISIVALHVAGFLLFLKLRPDHEAIKFFPLDESARFTEAYTDMNLKVKKETKYTLHWQTASSLNKEAYLRQDFSLLFQNGKLKEVMKKWNTNTAHLTQKKDIEGYESSLFQSVTIHYAELHGTNDQFRSAYLSTDSKLYVVASRFKKVSSFTQPTTNEEKEWALTLSMVAKERLDQVLEAFATKHKLNLAQYIHIPLTSLPYAKNKLLGEYSPTKQQEIIEKLWEGLYANYAQGIKKEDGTIVDARDSTIPIILHKKGTNRLYIVSRDKGGQLIELIQKIK